MPILHVFMQDQCINASCFLSTYPQEHPSSALIPPWNAFLLPTFPIPPDLCTGQHQPTQTHPIPRPPAVWEGGTERQHTSLCWHILCLSWAMVIYSTFETFLGQCKGIKPNKMALWIAPIQFSFCIFLKMMN